jgi:integrase
MLAAAEDEDRLMLATAVLTGARKGEVLGLTWADVNVQGRTIRIARQLDRWGKPLRPQDQPLPAHHRHQPHPCRSPR